jgi:hypothetical protein
MTKPPHSPMKILTGKLPILSELAPSPYMLQNTIGIIRIYSNAAATTSVTKKTINRPQFVLLLNISLTDLTKFIKFVAAYLLL